MYVAVPFSQFSKAPMSVSGFSTHSSGESDESIAFRDNDEIPPQGSLVPVLQHLLEEKGGTEAIQDMLAGLGLVTLARLDKDVVAGAAPNQLAGSRNTTTSPRLMSLKKLANLLTAMRSPI